MRGFGRRSLVRLAVGLACAGGLTAYATASSFAARAHVSSKPPVVIEMVTFTIPGLDFLTSYLGGAQAAAKAINAKGGFGGRKVVIDSCNGMLSPAADTVCANSSLANHPVAMIGCDTGWGTTGLEIYAAAGIPSLNNCSVTTQDVTNPYSFS